MAQQGTLTIHHPQGTQAIAVDVDEPASDLTEVLRRQAIPLNTRCGRKGLCDGCLVELLSGTLEPTDSGQLVTAQTPPSRLRACQHRMAAGGTAEIRVPGRSLLAHEPQVVTSFRSNVSRADEPLWQRITVKRDDLDPQRPMTEAICSAVATRLAQSLPVRPDPQWESLERGGQSDLELVVEYCGDHWSVRGPATSAKVSAYGIAIDVGTTTVVAVLVDLATGEVASTASALNWQTYLGDNVLTRINLCLQDKRKVGELQQAVAEKTLAPLFDRALAEAGVSAEQVVTLSVAGNSTMLHLLAGVDPSSMGTSPFTPQFLEHQMIQVADLPIAVFDVVPDREESSHNGQESTVPGTGRSCRPKPIAHLLPGAAAYVGADVTAGVFSSGMAYRSETCLLVDVGTNGEIVLQHDGHLIGCATAAGPAFEGAGLTHGVRAGKGAICHIRLDGNPHQPQTEVIGGGKPIGLCGTAYVDFIAQARRHGLIGPTGRITDEWADRELVRMLDPGRGFLIASGRGKEPMVITEADIASLLQAKAAIAAGILSLLSRFGLASHDVETLYLAGGFGFHMDVENLIGCGLIPGFRPSQVQVVGNTSLAGAYLTLLDAGAMEEIKRISTRMEIVELNLEPDFESRYIDQLFLP